MSGALVTLACGAAACGSSAAKNTPEAGEDDGEAGGGLRDGAGDALSGDTTEPDGEATDAAVSDEASDSEGSDAAPPAESSVGDGACTLGEVFSPPCNAISPSGPLVGTTCASGAAPSPQGGAVADGTYVLQSGTWYGSCPGNTTLQTTLVICDGVWNTAENATAPDAAGTALRVNYMAAVEDASVVLNPICTTGSPLPGGSYGFSASGRSLTRMTSYGSTVFVRVYSRQ